MIFNFLTQLTQITDYYITNLFLNYAKVKWNQCLPLGESLYLSSGLVSNVLYPQQNLVLPAKTMKL